MSWGIMYCPDHRIPGPCVHELLRTMCKQTQCPEWGIACLSRLEQRPFRRRTLDSVAHRGPYRHKSVVTCTSYIQRHISKDNLDCCFLFFIETVAELVLVLTYLWFTNLTAGLTLTPHIVNFKKCF